MFPYDGPDALVRARRHRRVLRPGAGQPGAAPGALRAVPDGAGVPRSAGLRPHPPRRRGIAPGRQSLLRLAGDAARPLHRSARRVRAALRHQHRLALRPRLPGDAPGEAGRRGGRRAGSGASGLAGGPGGLLRVRRHRAPGEHGVGAHPEVNPRAALLSTLAGIALTFIAIGFLFRAYTRPIIGLGTLAIILLVYFGRVRFRGGLPGGLVAIALGTCFAWLIGLAPSGTTPPGPTFHPPVPVLGALFDAFGGGFWATYFSVILPMGLFATVGSIENIESARAAGDEYPAGISLAVNGVGTLAACAFGSCFPTTLYIGHPGWKALGARAGYSVLNGAFMTLICLTGTVQWIAWAVPIDAGMAIVLWIGIVMGAQAFQVTPRAHAPAVVVGLLPSLAAWGVYMAKSGLHAAGLGAPGGPPFSADLLTRFLRADLWMDGALRLEQGFILSSVLLAAATVGVIERRFRQAALWCLGGAVLSAVGLIHSYRWATADTVLSLTPAWPWTVGYTVMAACFALAPWVTLPVDDASAGH